MLKFTESTQEKMRETASSSLNDNTCITKIIRIIFVFPGCKKNVGPRIRPITF